MPLSAVRPTDVSALPGTLEAPMTLPVDCVEDRPVAAPPPPELTLAVL